MPHALGFIDFVTCAVPPVFPQNHELDNVRGLGFSFDVREFDLESA